MLLCIDHLSEVKDLLIVQNNNLGLKPKYRPAVKFRNIDAKVLLAVQSGNDSETTPNEPDMDGLDSDDEADEGMDADKDSDQPAQPLSFEIIDPDIDINSPALKDMISMDPIAHETPLQPSSHSKAVDTSNVEPDWNW